MKIRDVIKRTIANNIKRARIDSNMTQAEAAAKLGITAQAISNFERGINGIENSLLLRMCEIYNTSMSRILGEENEKAPTENGECDILDEVDVAFYGDFKELNEDEKETVRDMVRLMRQRKEKRSQ